jgi:hypothetical protein
LTLFQTETIIVASKAEQLRAMREASAEDRAVPVKETETPKPTRAPSPPKPTKRKVKASNGSGKRFVPNRTKGRPHTAKAHLTNEARKPWEAMKISRRTWYRKMAKQPVI